MTEEGDKGTIARRAGVVAAGTFFSRLLGWARDAVMAAVFAVGATDIWVPAWTIPNSLRVLLGEGAVSAAVVPVFSEVKETEGDEPAKRFFSGLTGAMIVVLLVVTVLGILGAPWIVRLFAGGYEGQQFEDTVTLTRIVFPYIFLVGIVSLATGALNSMKRFAAPAFAPAFLNISLIAAPFLLVPVALAMDLPAITALAIGALAGGLLQILFLVPTLKRNGLLRVPRLGFRDPHVKKAFRLMVPLLAGLGVYWVNVMLSRLFASFLPEGAQSYLYYGQRIVEIPQGMFAFAIATATLPTLAALRSRGDDEKVKETFSWGLRLSLFVALPSTVALVLLAEPTIAVVFGRGQFDAAHVSETARSLVFQAAGVWAVASVRTVVPMFHAYNDTRTPVIASAANLVTFVGLCLGLMWWLEHVGIAIAFSVAAVVQLVVLIVLLRRKVGSLGLRRVLTGGLRMGIAAAAMGAAAYGITRLGDWQAGGNDVKNVVIYLAAVIVGAGIYAGAARLLGCPELGEVLAAVRKRRRRRT